MAEREVISAGASIALGFAFTATSLLAYFVGPWLGGPMGHQFAAGRRGYLVCALVGVAMVVWGVVRALV